MRPVRCLLALSICAFGIIFLVYHGPIRWSSSQVVENDIEESARIGTYFNWRTPSSLFPPSAIISLTDDNSTFFLARPAAFGPLLPGKSLSGQLWIGSGFGDDHSSRDSGPGGILEGELGCSDVPGWSDAELHKALAEARRMSSATSDDSGSGSDSENKKRGIDGKNDARSTLSGSKAKAKDDGTDNHLLSIKNGWRVGLRSQASNKKTHADIQSLQESAEIAGKVVLLTRGGCGFLDKVKWAQSRGAVAVIVGDDIRGGPLVTMYARGDTSNITIPALFTSHTTAHLLSSLMPMGGNKGMLTPEDSTRLGVGLGDPKAAKSSKSKERVSKKIDHKSNQGDKVPMQQRSAHAVDEATQQEGSGWFWSMFGTEDIHGKPSGNRLPPSDGNSDWILQTDFDVDEGKPAKKTKLSPTKQSRKSLPGTVDGFIIGVQDWRDPDLVADQKDKQRKLDGDKMSKKVSNGKAKNTHGGKEGTPDLKKGARLPAVQTPNTIDKDRPMLPKKSQGWFDRLVYGKQEEPDLSPAAITDAKARIIDSVQPVSNPVHLHDIHIPGAKYDEPTEHEGLWVTLTPTSMSSSPFFDTLLVLVVSPLVTLTVVYALLLLRSRIRRRRWRAPKSVVERLPVRTYQTMVSSPTMSTSSSVSTTATASTPLLGASNARPIRSRPRSRTDSEVPANASSSSQTFEEMEEKREAGLAEWRRKYGGRQKECVVCLDEYIDGVSRVMSLPCGHEFHEGCITPWLTTRRRTCPICKGDVVRSLARSHSSTSPAHQTIDEEDEEDIQEQAAVLTNDDPSSQAPISRDDEAFEDLERGLIQHPDRDR